MKQLLILILFLTLSVSMSAQDKVPGNEIWYTSSDGKIVKPYSNSFGGAKILSNTYENGKGVIKFDRDVTSIGQEAFYSCKSLTSVDLSNCTSIGESAFSYCSSLTSIDLPTCTSIGYKAFSHCSSLTSVDLSACTSIGVCAFYDCSSLTSVDLSNCPSIGSEAFSHCSSLTSVDLSAYTSIGYRAFSSCSSLTSVDLSSCTSIGGEAFSSCSSLTSVDLSSCTSIGGEAFSSCSSLASVGDLSACTSIGYEAFSSCSSLTSVDLSNCTSIEGYAFSYCSSLTSVGDLSACTSIGSEAFKYCSSLTSVGDLSACTSIGSGAFSYCSSLTKVGDLSACTLIGGSAFSYCSSLTKVGDLSACTSIGGSAFQGCSSLNKIVLSATTMATATGRNPTSEYTTVLVPANLVDDYRTADNWKDMAVRIISMNAKTDFNVEVTAMDNSSGLQNAINAIKDGDVANVISLKVKGDINGYDIMVMRNKMLNLHSLDLSEANIVEDANHYCYYDSYYTANDVFPSYAFYKISRLTNVKLPKTIKSIGNHAFDDCSFLNSITIPAAVKEIGDYAFQDAGFKNLSFEEHSTLETIGSYAFYSCELSEICIPSSVKEINSGAFYSCGYLRSVDFEKLSNLKTIGSHAFSSCGSLSNINLPSSLETIGSSAFQYSSLNDITIPSSVKKIERDAFSSCGRLETVTISSSVKSIGSSAFSGCSNLQSIYVTSLLPISISQDTFSNWTTATLYVPVDEETDWNATFNAYYWDTQWSQFVNLKGWTPTYDYFYVDDDYVLDRGEIPGDNPDADFGKESGFIVDKDAHQDMGEVNIDSDGSNGGSIIARSDAEEGNASAEKLNMKIQVNSGRWYFFSFPYDIPKADITCNANYVFHLYDGEERANGSSGWKNVTETDGEYLKAGKGYIFQCDKSTDLILTVDNPKFNGKNKNTTLTEASSENAQNANWNFVGNPFLSYFNMDDINYDCPITVWNGSSYEAIRPGDDDYSFHPFQAFFVQKPEGVADIEFLADGRETKTQSEKAQKEAKARRMMRKAAANRQLINLEISDGQNIDKTRVVFNQAKADAYEMDCDAAKFMSTEAVPQIYTLDSKGVKYAINERPDGNVKIGYEAKKAGLFTISAMRMEKAVSLLDKQTGELVSLEEPFTFSSKVGTFNDRFELVIGNPTDIRSAGSDKQGASTSDSFTLGGIRTDAGEKGIIISDGKKHLNK